MAIQWISGDTFTCVSGDTKPTLVPTDTKAIETNTDDVYRFNGTSWVLFVANDKTETLTNKTISGTSNTFSNIASTAMASAAGGRTKVYKVGATYYAEKHDGTAISSSGVLETVLQAALNLGGLVTVLQDGNFDFTSAGVTIPSVTTLYNGANTVYRVPSSSLNFVAFTMRGSGTNCEFPKLIGGKITKGDGNDASRNWFGVRILSTTLAEGVLWPVIQDLNVRVPYAGYWFDMQGQGNITTGHFLRCTAYSPAIGFLWSNSSIVAPGGMDECVFDSCTVQSHVGPPSLTITGFSDVYGNDLKFKDCMVWDMNIAGNPGQRTMTIHADSTNITLDAPSTLARNSPYGYFVNGMKDRSLYIGPSDWNNPSYGDLTFLNSVFVPNGRRTGRIYPLASTATSMVDGMLSAGAANYTGAPATSSNQVTFADGTAARRHLTGAVSGNGAGPRYDVPFTCRGWNPIFKTRFKLASTAGHTTTNMRIFFGWKSGITDLTGDDPLNAQSGVILCLRAADTNYQIACNDGTGVTTFTSTGVAKSTAVSTFELYALDAATNKWKWSINNNAWTDLTDANIPAQTTALTVVNQIQTAEAAVKSFDLFEVYVETN